MFFEGVKYASPKSMPAEIIRRVLMQSVNAYILFAEPDEAQIDTLTRYLGREQALAELDKATPIIDSDTAQHSPRFARMLEMLRTGFSAIESNKPLFAEFSELAKEFAGVDLAATNCQVCPERTFLRLSKQFNSFIQMIPFGERSDGSVYFLDNTKQVEYLHGGSHKVLNNNTPDFDANFAEWVLTFDKAGREAVVLAAATKKGENPLTDSDLAAKMLKVVSAAEKAATKNTDKPESPQA